MQTFIEAHADNTFGIRWCEGCEAPALGYAIRCTASDRVVWHMQGELGNASTIDAAMLAMERVHYRATSNRSYVGETVAA